MSIRNRTIVGFDDTLKKGHTKIPGLCTQELDTGLWTLDSGRWTLDTGLWTLDAGLWTLDAGLWTLDSGRWTLDSGPWTLSLIVVEQNQNLVSDFA